MGQRGSLLGLLFGFLLGGSGLAVPPGGDFAEGNPLPTFPITPLGSGVGATAAVMAAGHGPSGATPMPDPFMLSEQLEGMLGLATLPPKLMKRILNKEYIEMFEILPESWRLEMEASSPAGHGKRLRYPGVVRVLSCDGGRAVCGIPAESTTFIRIHANNRAGVPQLRGHRMGVVRHVVPESSSQQGFS